ncbi:family 20 glycosylhydrolase [Thomasclavelia cocleata]|uniref:family 20 glycosylhydrolase n=3 Tax=Thomasclavelia cocleata TaxID=69824 RepID=UPI00138F8182|nr:family 20 glycosylhydrolase [Thomasclavelia cocleata]
MKKIFVMLLCMSVLCSMIMINISAAEKEPLFIERVDNIGTSLGVEKISSDKQLMEIYNNIKDQTPTLSSDGKKIILPEVENDQYTISLYGTSNSAVISKDGQITQPLEDMIVYLYYQVENIDTKESLHMDDPIIVKVNGQYDDGQINRPRVLPGIREWKGNQGTFKFSGNIIIKDDSLKDTASKILLYIEEMTQSDAKIVTKQVESGDILFELDKNLSVGIEGYTIDIDDYVTVKAPEQKGLLYAGATLSQMLMDNQNMLLPKGLMRDYPQYQVRSTMLDVARFYMPLDYLEEITKYAAFYKLNEIHVHINDDGGEQSTAFRVESKKYPAINSGIPEEEVYLQEDYKKYQKEVYQYGVEVVTEIDTPAHCHSINYVDPSIMLDGSHIDLSNPQAVAFIKSLFNEFLDGEDPVFQNQKFNIGTDEYPSGHNEQMRAYMDELIKYVNSKNIQPRLWSGLNVEGSSYGGTTPVSNEAVFHFWARSFANLKLMLEGEYPMINNIDGYLYIVPAAGYQNYLNIKNLYDTWEAGKISNDEIVKPGHPLMLGSEAALWNDIKVGASEFDIFDRHRDQIMIMAEKNWYGEKTAGQTGEEFMERVEKFGQFAPNANPARYIRSNGEVIADYDFKDVDQGTVKDLSGNGYDAIVKELKVDLNKNALLLDGKGYVSLPFDSIGYPYTVDFEMMISSSTPANAVIFSGKDGVMYYNYDNTGKMGYQRKGYVYLFDYDIVENTMVNYRLTCSNTDLQLYIDNVLVGNGQYYKVSANKQASSTFVLPVEKIGSGIKGYLKSMTVFNQIKTSLVSESSNLALNKVVTVSGVEGGYNEDGTLVHPQFDPQNATDGDYNTRISLNRDDFAWVEIDLDEVCLLENIKIHFKEKPGSYKLYISSDKENWQCIDIQENIDGGSSGIDIHKLNQVTRARYVKYEQTKMFCATWAGNGYYSGNFTEFEVYGITETEINDIIIQANKALNDVEETELNRVFRELLNDNINELNLALQKGTYEEIKSLISIINQQVEQLYNGITDIEKTDKTRLKELLKESIDDTLYDSKALDNYVLAKRIGQSIYNDIYTSQSRINLAVTQIEEAKNQLYMKKFAIVTANGSPYQDPKTGYVYNAQYAFDFDTSTTYWKGNYQKAGDYVLIMFREPIFLETVRLVSDRDILKYGELQITKDGKTFETLQILQNIGDQTITLTEATNVLGIKVLATQDNDATWWRLNEIIINSQPIIDKKVLESELVREIDQSFYTINSYQNYLKFKQQAQVICNKEESTQREIDEAVEQLRQAYLSLDVLANKAELEKLVNEVIDANLYTEESYDVYLEILNQAKELLTQDEISQKDIDIVTWDLRESILKLERVLIDKSGLEEIINRVLLINSDDYTVESYQNLQTSLINAQSIFEKEDATQQEVDQAIEVLNDAINALEKIDVEDQANKLALQIAVEVADKVTDKDLENIVPAVVNEFKAALTNAKAVLDDANATQEQADTAFDRLANVMHMLEFFKGNKTDLDKLVTQIEGLNQADYSEVSWNAMLPVLDEAKDVLANENAMQEEVNEAYTELIKAFLELRLKPNKDLLQELINKANGLNAANYTAKSWQALQKEVEKASELLADPKADYATVEKAIESLKGSIEALEEKTPEVLDGKENAIKTGDSSNMSQLGVVMLLAGAAVVTLRRRKIEE